MNLKDIFNTIGAVIGLGITCLVGGWDSTLKILVLLMAIDYITGLVKGINDKELSSEIGSKGLIKKATIFIVIILAHQIDIIASKETPLFKTMTCYFYISNEGLSVIENLAALDVPLPKFIINVLEKIRDENNNLKLRDKDDD